MRRSVRFLVAVLVLAVLAAGCGGDSGEDSSSTTAPETSPATTSAPGSDPRTPGQLAADRAAAEEAVLTLADFPPGWTAEPDTDETSPEEEAAGERFAACLGVDEALVGGGARAGARATSDDFEDEDNNSVQSTVTMVFSRERALQQLETFRKPEAGACFEAFVDAAIEYSIRNPGPGQTTPPELTFGDTRVDVLRPAGLNTDSVGYRARVPLTVGDESADAIFDIILALKGRAGITMIFIGIGGPFPSALETSLTNKVIDRAPAA
ncbi:MAG TPA: hypothetical protein VG455_16375 [Acidimicrobiales bacterium]|nr:hypothetical protein [Acidimicrobiales bacterium]